VILEAGYRRPYEKDHADEMAWMCKALAASGDSQYMALFERIMKESPSVKIRRYARQSTELLEQYAQRSQVLNATDHWDESLSAEDNRLISMLRSDDLGLKRDAAKMIVRSVGNDAKVYAAAALALQGMAQQIKIDSLYVDTMAWLCKALAASGDSDYIADLKALHDGTDNYKLKTYTKKAIRALN